MCGCRQSSTPEPVQQAPEPYQPPETEPPVREEQLVVS